MIILLNLFIFWLILINCERGIYEEDNIIAVYVVDNNFKENRIFTYGIHYLKDIYKNHDDEQGGNHPYVIKYNTGITEKNQHIGLVITLDKGEAQWQKWLNSH